VGLRSFVLRVFPVAVFSILAFLLFPACNSDEASPLAAAEEVVEQLNEFFIGGASLTSDEINKAAIQGILDFVDDPYTSYLGPQRFTNFTESLNGVGDSFEGIGAEISVHDGRVMIVGPLPGSPAIKAGVQPGDIVLQVDGHFTDGLDLLEAVALIRGPKDSTVVLTILRAGSLRPMDISVVRDTIELTSVLARMQQDGVGYIRLNSFDAVTTQGLIQAIAELREAGAKSLILDLRNNTGGLVSAAVGVVSEFVDEGVVCTGCNPGEDEDLLQVSGVGSAFDLPLVLLVNGFSASASEIVAGALQDHDRATIIGTTTFGKGSVNLLLGLESGAGLYVTVARWFTPNGQVIEGHGIIPDIVVGTNVDIQAVQRLGALTQSLCAALIDERGNLEGQDLFLEALDGLCTLEVTSSDEAFTDEQLNRAVIELGKWIN
jgi:carboxyl-terminal processing protease